MAWSQNAGAHIAMVEGMQRIGLSLVALVCVLLLPSTARAEVILSATGTGSNGVTLNASAAFSISTVNGINYLTMTLQNSGDTSGSGKVLSSNTLTGLFFDLPAGITLTPTSARIAKGDLLQSETCEPS